MNTGADETARAREEEGDSRLKGKLRQKLKFHQL